jgi:hypothetical protein
LPLSAGSSSLEQDTQQAADSNNNRYKNFKFMFTYFF